MGWGEGGEGTGNDNFNLINSTGSNFPSQWGRGGVQNVMCVSPIQYWSV